MHVFLGRVSCARRPLECEGLSLPECVWPFLSTSSERPAETRLHPNSSPGALFSPSSSSDVKDKVLRCGPKTSPHHPSLSFKSSIHDLRWTESTGVWWTRCWQYIYSQSLEMCDWLWLEGEGWEKGILSTLINLVLYGGKIIEEKRNKSCLVEIIHEHYINQNC